MSPARAYLTCAPAVCGTAVRDRDRLAIVAECSGKALREPGGVILAHGDATFIHSLIRDGLIDEYRLVIHPVAIGRGTGLFSSLAKTLRLEVVEAHTYPSGTAIKNLPPTGQLSPDDCT